MPTHAFNVCRNGALIRLTRTHVHVRAHMRLYMVNGRTYHRLRRGGKVICVGLFGGKLEHPLPMIPLQGHSFIGSLTGTIPEAKELFQLLRDGKISPCPYHERSISEINQAIEELRAGKYVGRCVFRHDWPEGKV